MCWLQRTWEKTQVPVRQGQSPQWCQQQENLHSHSSQVQQQHLSTKSWPQVLLQDQLISWLILLWPQLDTRCHLQLVKFWLLYVLLWIQMSGPDREEMSRALTVLWSILLEARSRIEHQQRGREMKAAQAVERASSTKVRECSMRNGIARNLGVKYVNNDHWCNETCSSF